MNKSVMILLVFMFLLSSCMPQESNESSSGSNGGSSSYGVQVSFVEGVPSDTFYVEGGLNRNANFEVAVDIQNKGEFPQSDIESLHGRLYLTGYDPSILRSRRWDGGDSFDRLHGVSSSYPEGGSVQKSFIADEINFPSDRRKEYPISLVLNACYYYETHATATICVDPDPSRSADQACRVGDVRLDAQNAPLQVTRITQSASSDELIFAIKVANMGNGNVLKEFGGNGVISDGRCLSPDYDEEDRIVAEASVTGLPAGECNPSSTTDEPLRLYDGTGEFVCRFPMDNLEAESAYTTQMDIRLRYGYHTNERKTVTLVNMAQR